MILWIQIQIPTLYDLLDLDSDPTAGFEARFDTFKKNYLDPAWYL